MKFVCPDHGEVQPTRTGYSYPMTGWCPICDKPLSDLDATPILNMSEADAKKARPSFYKNTVDTK